MLQALEEVVWACLPKITRDIWQQTPHRMYSAEAEVNFILFNPIPSCLNPTYLPQPFTIFNPTPCCHRQYTLRRPRWVHSVRNSLLPQTSEDRATPQ